jgi:hypothetical protein
MIGRSMIFRYAPHQTGLSERGRIAEGKFSRGRERAPGALDEPVKRKLRAASRQAATAWPLSHGVAAVETVTDNLTVSHLDSGLQLSHGVTAVDTSPRSGG